MTRIAVLSDVHGNLPSRSRRCARRSAPRSRTSSRSPATSSSTARTRPGTVDLLREMEADGAAIVSGNTDIAVADFDYARGVPVDDRRRPRDVSAPRPSGPTTQLGDERVAWLRRLPSERRLRAEDGTMILVCHASPGSQTAGFDQALDPNVVIERVAPDRRPGHRLRPHPRPRGPRPRLEAHRQRRFGAATSSTATRPPRGRGSTSTTARSRRRSGAPSSTSLAVANAISARGLPGDVYRAATVRTGKLVR